MGMQPKLRFKGFTDDWEKRKLESIFKERTERSSEGTMLSVTINDGVVLANSLSRKNVSSSDKSNYKLVRKDDIAYNSMRMWQSASGVSNYEGIVSPAYTVLIPEHDVNSSFFGYYFKRTVMKQVFQKNSQGLTSDTWNLKYPLLKNIVVQIPSIEEQIKISEFLKQVDKLIAVNQRKVDLLKKKKAGYLQKLFPRNGQNKPELRFKGYTDAWEKRKLKDFLIESRDKGTDGLKAKKLTVKLWGKGVVKKESVYLGSSATKYFTRHAGQLMYGKLDFLHGAFGIVPQELEGYESTLDSPAFNVLEINQYFLLQKLLQKNFYLYEGLIANGSRKAKRIHVDTFLDMSVKLPKREEQDKVACIFQNLDQLITVNQRKVDLLKKEKKSLLQKMFV